MSKARSLDVGCGVVPRNPFKTEEFYGLDIKVKDECSSYIKKCILGYEKIPFEDNFFDYITAYDLLEHIPRTHFDSNNPTIIHNPFIFLLNELHRILKKGGYFYAFTPAYPAGSAFCDPTHCNFISFDTASYFGGNCMTELYGIKQWQIKEDSWRANKYAGILRADMTMLNNFENIIRVKIMRQRSHLAWVFQKIEPSA